MKTQDPIAFTSDVAPRRSLTMRTAVASETITDQGPDAIRPFHVNIPEAELTELRRRVAASRFPEKKTVSDFSQGVPLATVQKLAQSRTNLGLTRTEESR